MNERQIAILAALLAPAALAGCAGPIVRTTQAAAPVAPSPSEAPATAAGAAVESRVTAVTTAASTTAVAAAEGTKAVETAAPASPAAAPKVEGLRTVEELFRDREALAGKEVSVRGKVVKYKAGIMGKNWLHLQDGTGAQGTNDLTVTTSAETDVGKKVLVKGVAAVNKDFGYGYKYDLIVEDAAVTAE